MNLTHMVIADDKLFLNKKAASAYLKSKLDESEGAERKHFKDELHKLYNQPANYPLPRRTPRACDYPLNIMVEMDIFRDEDMEDAVLPDDFIATLDYLLTKVSERNRHIFYSRFKEGQTYEQIAAPLGVSIENVRARLTKVFRVLRNNTRMLAVGIMGMINDLRGTIRDLHTENNNLRYENNELRQKNGIALDVPIKPIHEQKREFAEAMDRVASVRLKNILYRAGIYTRYDLLHRREPFSKIRNCGAKAFEELQSVCEQLGWDFEGIFEEEKDDV